MAKLALHHQIADKVMDLMSQGTHGESNSEKFSNHTIVQVKQEGKSFRLGGEIFISSSDVYDGLSNNAIKLVIQIQRELKMNNPLWEFKDKANPRMRTALAQLKRNDIIEAIKGTNMFIVNPAKLRKGKPLSVYGALYDYARKKYSKDRKWRPTSEDIKRFSSPHHVTLLPADLLLHASTSLEQVQVPEVLDDISPVFSTK